MPDSDSALHALDEALAGVRTTQQGSVYRRRVTAGLDIPGGYTGLRVLRAIERHSTDAAPSISDIANRLAIEHSTASRAVDSVVSRGMATRTSCSDDQRRIRLALTDDGRALLRESTARRVELLTEITDGWSADEVSTLHSLLERLLDGFERVEGRA